MFLALAWGVAFRLGISILSGSCCLPIAHEGPQSDDVFFSVPGFPVDGPFTSARTSTGDLRRSPNSKRPYMSASRSHTVTTWVSPRIAFRVFQCFKPVVAFLLFHGSDIRKSPALG